MAPRVPSEVPALLKQAEERSAGATPVGRARSCGAAVGFGLLRHSVSEPSPPLCVHERLLSFRFVSRSLGAIWGVSWGPS